ncbi:glycosyltransferase [Candidatus Gracilibacteria bacterium]|nr:glycosyltransferase [Candidatus Gracilibacteria bacterium]
MQNLENKKIAIVCDWIKDWGGAELVLAQFLEIFPNADIFTSVFFQEENPIFHGRKITTSFIQQIPFFNQSHKLALTLRPRAFESFDLSEYDIVISSTSAESKGVITKPECIQICYCHTPTRYFWSHYHEYLQMMEFGILNPIGKLFMPTIVHFLRKWDFIASQRPDYFIANSKNTAKRIKKYYRRKSEVIYPCIDTEKFDFREEKEDFYLYVGRCIPYKKFDLIIDAFNKNGKKIVIVTNTDNKLYKKLKSISKENITWKLNISREETRDLFSRAKAFLFPPEEDFGLVPIESMACGTPVIAYGKGGALETVIEGETGIFFNKQTVESLNDSIKKFETLNFDAKKLREHALNFDKRVFKEKILEFVNEKMK